jgi:hypothetical protein
MPLDFSPAYASARREVFGGVMAHRLVVNLRPTASRPPDAASHDDAEAADR